MNILESAKQFAGGAAAITAWLGSGGEVVSYEEAQARANICKNCAKNVEVGFAKTAISDAARKALEIKNKIRLKLAGEKSLGKCEPCGCVLKLLCWEPQKRIEPFLTVEDRKEYPAFCWKLKKP